MIAKMLPRLLVDVPSLSSFQFLVLLPVSTTLLMYVDYCVCLSREWFSIVIVEFVEKLDWKSL